MARILAQHDLGDPHMSRFRLRPVLPSEQKLVYGWRSDPAVRRVMPNTDVVEPERHKNWWPTALADPERRMMMLDDGQIPVALIVFFDLKHGHSANWGFYADTSLTRADRLAMWLTVELSAIEYAFDHLYLEHLFCETRETHHAVLLLHDHTGFVDAGQGQPGFVRKRFTRAGYESLRKAANLSPLADILFEKDPRDLRIPSNIRRRRS